MNFVGAILALDSSLPPVVDMCEYVVAAEGLYIRAEDGKISALVPVTLCAKPLTGLAIVEPFARLLVPLVPQDWLDAIHKSAKKAMPAEAMYQLVHDDAARNSRGGWAAHRPRQVSNPVSVTFADVSAASVDLHSHNSMRAFFSGQDDADEQGLRFYCVIGRLDSEQPEIAARVGVYGHTMRVPSTTIFEALGPFTDTFGHCRVCGCTEDHACAGGCYWVEEDLCSKCADGQKE